MLWPLMGGAPHNFLNATRGTTCISSILLCANDVADTASITTANNREPTDCERMERIATGFPPSFSVYPQASFVPAGFAD